MIPHLDANADCQIEPIQVLTMHCEKCEPIYFLFNELHCIIIFKIFPQEIITDVLSSPLLDTLHKEISNRVSSPQIYHERFDCTDRRRGNFLKVSQHLNCLLLGWIVAGIVKVSWHFHTGWWASAVDLWNCFLNQKKTFFYSKISLWIFALY